MGIGSNLISEAIEGWARSATGRKDVLMSAKKSPLLSVAKVGGATLGTLAVGAGAVLGGCRMVYDWGSELHATPAECAMK
jgi:hypothetical protein